MEKKRKPIMLKGEVIAAVTSTVKHPSMQGWKLLLIRSEGIEPVLAIDTLGAGLGAQVIITSDGKFTSETIGSKATPVRWSVIGLVQ